MSFPEEAIVDVLLMLERASSSMHDQFVRKMIIMVAGHDSMTTGRVCLAIDLA